MADGGEQKDIPKRLASGAAPSQDSVQKDGATSIPPQKQLPSATTGLPFQMAARKVEPFTYSNPDGANYCDSNCAPSTLHLAYGHPNAAAQCACLLAVSEQIPLEKQQVGGADSLSEDF
ncbi:hypothetical protein H920_01129 [Fukomys damarensis]|uniref:Uncharacterized protein n=1 Tax=Fukomys damarensis TaxID=885580 RepID=A0A091E414_FUKDA|nr:hypothetical protein H920_01129 [Fukomys damarensis]